MYNLYAHMYIHIYFICIYRELSRKQELYHRFLPIGNLLYFVKQMFEDI